MEVDDILRDFNNEVDKSQKVDLYTRMSHVMLNERMAPELLPYEKELLDEILSKITDQQQLLLDSHEYGDLNIDTGIITSDFKLQLMIMETDIERLNYLIRLYFRIRLAKLEKYTLYYIKLTSQDDKKMIISEQERDYMYKYMTISQTLYNNSILKKVPKELSYLDDEKGDISMVVQPDIDELVFIKVITLVPITITFGEDELDLVKDGIFAVRYSLIRKYLELGDVRLI